MGQSTNAESPYIELNEQIMEPSNVYQTLNTANTMAKSGQDS